MPAALSPSLALELISGPALPPIGRPLARQGGHTYAALWPFVRRPETKQPVKRQLVFVRDDGLLHLPAASPPADSEPLGSSRLPSELPDDLPVPEDRLWSAGGVQLYLAGQRPDPAAVFQRLTRVLAHFVDFTGSLAEPSVMAEFFAAYLLSTWFAPAFPVLPLLWITGDGGSGKSRLLGLLAQLAYLGVLLPALPPFEPLCALAGLGASVALDDAFAFTAQGTGSPSWPRRGPYAVLVAGRQRGPLLPLAGLGPSDPPRQLDVYGPRLFAAKRPPHSALAGYCLAVPLFRSLDTALMARDPLEPAAWPAALADAACPAAGLDSPRALIDDLWALALSRLAELPPHLLLASQAAASSDLTLPTSHFSPPTSHLPPLTSRLPLLGSGLQPWHAVLAVASWLSGLGDQGVPGLFDRLAPLARPAQGILGLPASTDSAALALQGIYVFAIALLGRLAKAHRRAIAMGRFPGLNPDDNSDSNDDGNDQEIGQNGGDDSNDSRIDLVDIDGLGDFSPSGLYSLLPRAGAPPAHAGPRPPLTPTWPTVYTFTAGALLECMLGLAAAQAWDLPRPGLTDVHVGRLLSQLGLRYHRTAQRRTWSVTPAQLVRLSRAYNLPIPPALAPALNQVIQQQASKK